MTRVYSFPKPTIPVAIRSLFLFPHPFPQAGQVVGSMPPLLPSICRVRVFQSPFPHFVVLLLLLFSIANLNLHFNIACDPVFVSVAGFSLTPGK